MSDYSYLYDEFPEVISGEQLRKILHVSKRKCAWLLNNGIIPCTDSSQRTRRYSVKIDDVIAYIVDLNTNPQNHIYPIGAFTSKPTQLLIMPQKLPEGFRELLIDEWFNVPDVLTITDVAGITGYTPNAVDNWIVKGSLRSVIVQTCIITCREWLIDFYCDDGYNIVKKVDKHRKLLGKLLH